MVTVVPPSQLPQSSMDNPTLPANLYGGSKKKKKSGGISIVVTQPTSTAYPIGGGGSSKTTQPQSSIATPTQSSAYTFDVRRTTPRELPRQYFGRVLNERELNKNLWYDSYKVIDKPISKEQTKEEVNKLAEIKNKAIKERNALLKKLGKQGDTFILDTNIEQMPSPEYTPGAGPRLKSEGLSMQETMALQPEAIIDKTIIEPEVAKLNEDILITELKHQNEYSKINNRINKYTEELNKQVNSGQLDYDRAVAMQQDYLLQQEQEYKISDDAYYAQVSYLQDRTNYNLQDRIAAHEKEMANFTSAMVIASSLAGGLAISGAVRGVSTIFGATAGRVAGGAAATYFGGMFAKEAVTQAPGLLYQASMGNVSPLFRFGVETTASFAAGGYGYKLIAPKSTFTVLNKVKRTTPVVERVKVKDISIVSKSIDKNGNEYLNVKSNAVIELVDPRTGKVVKEFNAKVETRVDSTTNEQGIINSVTNSVNEVMQTAGKGRTGRVQSNGDIVYTSDVSTSYGEFTLGSAESVVSKGIVDTNNPVDLFLGRVRTREKGQAQVRYDAYINNPAFGSPAMGKWTLVRGPTISSAGRVQRVKPQSATSVFGKLVNLKTTESGMSISKAVYGTRTTRSTTKVKGYKRTDKGRRAGPFSYGILYNKRVAAYERRLPKWQRPQYGGGKSFIFEKPTPDTSVGEFIIKSKAKTKSVSDKSATIGELSTRTTFKDIGANLARTKVPKKTVTVKKPISQTGYNAMAFSSDSSVYAGKGEYEQSMTFNDIVNIPLQKDYKPVQEPKEGFDIGFSGADRTGTGELIGTGEMQDVGTTIGVPIITGQEGSFVRPNNRNRGRFNVNSINRNIQDNIQRQGQEQRQQQTPRLATPQITPIVPITRTPTPTRTKPPVEKPPKKTYQDEERFSRSEFGFIPEARTGKGYVPLTRRPVSKSRALLVGSGYVDTTLSKSFRIVPTRTKVKKERFNVPTLSKFRTYQQKRGKRIYTPFTFYEKRKFALEPGEQRTIRPLKVSGIKRAAERRRSSLGLF